MNILKSKTTELHLARSHELTEVMQRLNAMSLDVIKVDYDAKRIEIANPPNDCKVVSFPPLRGENNITLMKMMSFVIWWHNPKSIKEIKYGNA